MPSSFYVTDASPERPFLALCLDLDKYLITRLAAEVPPPCATGACLTRGLSVADVDPDITMRSCASSSFSETGADTHTRAAHCPRNPYRLLIGPWNSLRRLNTRHPEQSDRPSHHVVMGQLQGTVAGRQAGSEGKHGHLHVPPPFFKEVTTLSPLQFHKRSRLYEAKRLMLTEGDASSASLAVGYESPTQFNRGISGCLANRRTGT